MSSTETPSPFPRPPSPPRPSSTHEVSRNPLLDSIHYSQYTSRESAHERANEVQVARELALIREKQFEADYYSRMRRAGSMVSFGAGYGGYGNSTTGMRFRYVLPQHRRRPRPRQRELRVPKKRAAEQALEPEALVPIRLDVESEKHKLRDTFTWNAHETTVPLEWFAEILCEDFAIPPDRAFIHLVQKSIQEQLSDYHPHALNIDEEDLEEDPNGGSEVDPALPYTAYKDDDMRITIRLDITVGTHNLRDKFHWDINNSDNNPERFAEQLCLDLSLSAEFATAIAHSIREQSQMYTKSLFLVGHPFDGRVVEDEDIRSSLLPTLTSALHADDQVVTHAPQLYELSEAEIERQDKAQDREARRKRRQGRARRGVVLPDFREPLKTHRTQYVSSVLAGGTNIAGATFKRHIRGTSPSDDIFEATYSPQHPPHPARSTPRKITETMPVQMMSPQLSRHSGPNRLIVKVRVPQLGALISDIERARHYVPPAFAPPANQPQNVGNIPPSQPIELPPVFPLSVDANT
jgi:SWI/SNF-related matrix-associated actin-dependent regulator of chromatin subfamily B member 1